MSFRNVLLVALLFFVGSNVMNAQTNLSTNLEENLLASNTELLNLSDTDWSFYSDEENQLYYIDFETIQVNLSEVVVKNQEGEILLKDDVYDLPVNTIYELDFSPYGSGTYEVELRSFTKTIEKKINIE